MSSENTASVTLCPRVAKNAALSHRPSTPFGHRHAIPTHQDDVIKIQQLMANNQPIILEPVQVGSEKTLDRPVAAPFIAPARQTSHGHVTADREHDLDQSPQLTRRRRLSGQA